jgi:hypothetical protein
VVRTASLEQRINRFAAKLKRDFAPEIREDQSAFKIYQSVSFALIYHVKGPDGKEVPRYDWQRTSLRREYKSKGKNAAVVH